jgi:hypothetical protein
MASRALPAGLRNKGAMGPVEQVVRRLVPWMLGIPAVALVCGLVFAAAWIFPAGTGSARGQTAPDFPTRDPRIWINSAPLSISELKGQVVLIDVWTYG